MPGCISTKDIGVDTESETAEGGGGDGNSMGGSETSAATESQGGSSMSGPPTQGGSDTSAASESDTSGSETQGETDVLPETESDSEASAGSDSSGVADTDTTGEVDPVDMCEQTGGTWDENSCGHYACGEVPDCDAVIPGCDCGEGQVFGPGGCEESLQCVSLACGELVCAAAEELCSVFVSGVKGGGNSYACNDLPPACSDDPTCECIEPLLKNGDECTDADGGGVVVTTYGA